MFKLFAIGGVVILWTAFIVCWLHEKGVFKNAEKRLKAQSWLTRVVCGGMLAAAIVYGGTKPDYGGGSTGGDGGAVTNVVEGADGKVRCKSEEVRGGGDTLERLCNQVSEISLSNFLPVAANLLPLTSNLLPRSPRIAENDYAAGFTIQGLGTNETFDFAPPETAVVATNWLLHGASTQPLRLSFGDWTFPFGEEGYSNFTVFASGEVMPGGIGTNCFLKPFAASLGIVPAANWGLLAESSRPSLFWWKVDSDNALLLTWQNVLLDRQPANPVSFQVELKPSGGFVFRYDLSRLAADELLTNVTVGVCDGRAASPRPPQSIQNEGSFVCDFGGADGVRALPGRVLSSLSFVSRDEQLCDENREDFDEKIGDEEPYAYPQGSTNTVLEHVFYSGTTNGAFAYPQSTDESAVLRVSVSGSGSGELMVGSTFVPLVGRPAPVSAPRLFAAPPPSPTTLAVTVSRGSTQKVYMRGDSTLSVSFSSEDFAFGSLPGLSGRHFKGWINFPFVNATVPCIHDYTARKKLVSLPLGDGADELTCEWQGTSQIEVENIHPVSAMLTGHFGGRTTTPVSYTLSHPKYLFGQATYSQTARYCPQPPEEDDEDPDRPHDHDFYDGEDDDDDDEEHYCWCCFWGSCYEGCGCGCSCSLGGGDDDEPEEPSVDPEPEDYDEASTNYPSMSGVLKIRAPLEYTQPIHLTVPDEHRNCCPCPDHASNWVAVVYQSQHVKVVDTATEQDFARSGESLDVKIAGVSPSFAVGDAGVSFAANGDVCLECKYTALGVGIGKEDADLHALNEANPDFGLPVPVASNASAAASLTLKTLVRLPGGNIHLGLEGASGEFTVWYYDASVGECRILVDSSSPSLDVSYARWRQMVGGSTDVFTSETPIYVTSASAGSATLVYRYWGVFNGKLVEDETRQVVSSVDPLVLADVNRDGRIDGADAGCQLAGTPFRFWYNEDVDKGDYIGQWPDVRPNWETDPNLARVKGRLDLVNLFPVLVDVSAFRQVWGDSATFRLHDRSGYLRYCRLSGVSPDVASSIQTTAVETDAREPLESAVLHAFDPDGVDVGDWLDGNGRAMLAVMAGGPIDPWNGPELVVSLGDAEVFRSALPLQIMSVDAMYWYADLRPAAESPWFTPTVPGMPPNLPDGGRDVDVFFTHGFNVSAPDARKWGRILFKRLWLSGFNARLHMLTWEGNYSLAPGEAFNGLHYQHDVWYAQRTAGALRRYVEAAQPDSSKRILMTQSLGNMVACEALREGLAVGKYFMFDAAVPSEAVDGTLQDADSATRMKYVPSTWQDYANACWAANWFKWFKDDPNDARGKIGWPDRFASALANAAEVYNYYSSGDDVFKELAAVPSRLDGVTESTEMYCWQKQEALKGAQVAAGTAYGGWGFHEWVYGQTHDGALTFAHYSAAEAAAMVADGSVTNTPVFNRGFAPMFDRNASLDDQRLALAKYVPAVSSAVGGKSVGSLGNNINMDVDSERVGVPRPNGWGRTIAHKYGLDWQHSDMKDMAYFYVYKLYEQLIQKGNLK